ncbi:MAG: hypothetical protein PHU31_01645 [Anaerotignum sp.]|nr:hypothetical protein [Anaerotignum sp.]
MIHTNLFQPTASHKIVASQGCFSLLEYEKDISVTPESAQTCYFASKMNIRKRQVIANLNGSKGKG